MLHGFVDFVWDCANTNWFAFDSVCDEVAICNLGTDCCGCGPVVFRGLFECIYQEQEDGSIRLIRSETVVEEDASLANMSISYDGVLSR